MESKSLQDVCSDSLTEDEISARLFTKWVGKHLVCHETTGSTNNDAKKKAEEGAKHGTLIVADTQTAGRGRRGRGWESEKGETISATLLLRPDFPTDKASMLTLVMAVSVARAIEEETSLSCQIKWPNDLVVNQKKVCGILTEMSVKKNAIDYVVIGFGINCNNRTIPQELVDKATSLKAETGICMNRASLIAKAVKCFEEDYERFLKTLDLSLLLEEYNNHLVNRNRKVRVLEPTGEYEATAQGVNKEGELVVQKENGEICCVYSGEVSVRGIYGYV